MGSSHSAAPDPRVAEQVLGYLNFSSGVSDVQFLKNLNTLFAECEMGADESELSTANRVLDFLKEQVGLLAGSDANFQNAAYSYGRAEILLFKG